MSERSLGSDAKVLKGGTEIGFATGARCGIDVDIIKEYIIGRVNPGV